MTKRNRRRYSDKFKAGALTLLASERYPEDRYALQRVADHLGIPNRTLFRWFNGDNGEPPADLVAETKRELADLFEDEIREAIKALPQARDDASYRDLVMGSAILTDKVQLLRGQPTSINEENVNITDERQNLLGKLAGIATYQRPGAVREQPDALRTDDA